jgi:FtsP/CotA-like multicopper oxidase with cupredoxin domain
MSAAMPQRRPRPLRTMADMGMDMSGMAGMDMKGTETPATKTPDMGMTGHQTHGMDAADTPSPTPAPHDAMQHKGMAGMEPMQGMEMPGRATGGLQGPSLPGSPPVPHGPDTHGPGNSAIPMETRSRLASPGAGFEGTNARVLVYTDLKSLAPQPDQRAPEREIELHITGNIERYMWSFNGKKYAEAPAPIAFHYGERLRLILVNDTMPFVFPYELYNFRVNHETRAAVSVWRDCRWWHVAVRTPPPCRPVGIGADRSAPVTPWRSHRPWDPGRGSSQRLVPAAQGMLLRPGAGGPRAGAWVGTESA